ncbi:hypothetical protein [Methylobrevis albus]|uniref:Uncharacterized protein n=1 Tax=Methylobrevis albus TaxID=2793297 RepID=A0A931N033_9HYPH|nr:hypothetical protein [Methylobrevis albus]MBH0239650.1 hypothetical protein [Methylobrevis albus]
MSTATVYIVTPFRPGARGSLAPGEPRRCSSEAEAMRAADAMMLRARGVIVLRQQEDPQVDFFGEPSVIARRGDVPEIALD